jgi:Uma2 family endonuclease
MSRRSDRIVGRMPEPLSLQSREPKKGKGMPVVSSHGASAAKSFPRVEAGDHLDQATFHERYKAMPPWFHAELIGGVVIVPSPLLPEHGEYHALVMGWLTQYWIRTPGTVARDNATVILGPSSEPQPDGILIVDPARGGQTGYSADGYATGPPELIVEVASSSESIDLNTKLRDYEQAGVLEYLVVVVRRRVIRWFVLQEGQYQETSVEHDGILRSRVFPGLWLDVEALLQLDGLQVMDTLQQGVATLEHAAFVQQLRER